MSTDPDDGCLESDIHTDIFGTWHLHGSQWILERIRRQLPEDETGCSWL